MDILMRCGATWDLVKPCLGREPGKIWGSIGTMMWRRAWLFTGLKWDFTLGRASLVAQWLKKKKKKLACQCRRQKRHGFDSLGWEDPRKKEVATHSSILAWEISHRQSSLVGHSPGGPKRVGHNLMTKQQKQRTWIVFRATDRMRLPKE